MKKKNSEREPQSLGKLLHEFQLEDRVVVKIDSSLHEGKPHIRYRGKVGIIEKKRGSAYIIRIKEGQKIRSLIICLEHLMSHFN